MISQSAAVRIFANLVGSREGMVIIAAGDDDCGAVAIDGTRALVATTDYTNFKPHSTTYGIGSLLEKAQLLVLHNASDLIATGVRPLAFVASIGIPGNFTEEDVRQLARGLRDGAKRAGVTIIGGDTKEAPQLTLCGTAMGMATQARLWRRSNGSPFDDLYLTGPVGGVSAAVWLLAQKGDWVEGERPAIAQALMQPALPLNVFGSLEGRRFRIAAIDISDGLGVDLHTLAECSEVGIVVEGDKVPIHPLATRVAKLAEVEAIEFAFGFGGDLQFVFAAQKKHRSLIEATGALRVGRLTGDPGRVVIYRGREYELPKFGHSDFESIRPGEKIAQVIGKRFGDGSVI